MSSLELKVGQRVRVVKEYMNTVGKRYGKLNTITSISDCGGYIRLNGDTSGHTKYCFELAAGSHIDQETGERYVIT